MNSAGQHAISRADLAGRCRGGCGQVGHAISSIEPADRLRRCGRWPRSRPQKFSAAHRVLQVLSDASPRGRAPHQVPRNGAAHIARHVGQRALGLVQPAGRAGLEARDRRSRDHQPAHLPGRNSDRSCACAGICADACGEVRHGATRNPRSSATSKGPGLMTEKTANAMWGGSFAAGPTRSSRRFNASIGSTRERRGRISKARAHAAETPLRRPPAS